MDLTDYVTAVLNLKTHLIYDWYVQTHVLTMGRDPMQAHESPMFLPWHRQFLLKFERDLGLWLKKPYALPYWDWTDPSSGKVVWGDNFMGGDGNPVTTGPFRRGSWTLADGTALIRQMGEGVPSLPSAADVTAALDISVYDGPPWTRVDSLSEPGVPAGYQSFRNQLEGWLNGPKLHNQVHMWVGGSMMKVSSSPNDPVFFPHHANVDRIWSLWQQKYYSSAPAYLPVFGAPPGLGANDPMWPWDGDAQTEVATPADVLSTSKLGYIYDTDIQHADPFGGPHGDNFDDSFSIVTIPATLASVSATWNTALTSFTTTYTDGTTIPHGKASAGDTPGYFPISADLNINSVTVLINKQHDWTGVVGLYLGQSPYIGPVPEPAGIQRKTFTVPQGRSFAGFWGRASNRIYSLGIVTFPT